MTVVNTETGEIVERVSVTHARRWAERARLDLERGADNTEAGLNKIRTAIAERHDEVLGYASLGKYLSTEYADALGNLCRVLGREFRREVVAELTTAGLSTRAIAPVVDASQSTVRDDQRVVRPQVSSSTHLPQTPAPESEGEADDGAGQTPEGGDAPSAAATTEVPSNTTEAGDTPAPRPPVIGIDGKTYTRPTPSAPRRAPLTDSFFRTVHEAERRVESLHRLVEDDRWTQNAEKVASAHRGDLLRIRDLLEQVINSLPSKESTP